MRLLIILGVHMFRDCCKCMRDAATFLFAFAVDPEKGQGVSSVREYQSWAIVKAVKTGFLWGQFAIGEKRLQYRTGLNCEYKQTWVFL